MKAEITYNDGRSCTIKRVRFENGRTRLIDDPEIIAIAQRTAGFAVHIPKAAKAAKAVVEPPKAETKPSRKIVPVVRKRPVDESDE